MTATPWAWVNPVKEENITGRWRTRTQRLTGKLIVQVQLARTHVHHLSGTYTATTHIWRDATAHDLAMLAGERGRGFDVTPPSRQAARA